MAKNSGALSKEVLLYRRSLSRLRYHWRGCAVRRHLWMGSKSLFKLFQRFGVADNTLLALTHDRLVLHAKTVTG